MRILWFTNTPSLASQALNDKGNIGGWIAALESEVAKVEEIELAVAFHYGTSEKKQFSIGKTKYFSFPNPILSKGHTKGIISRWQHKIEPIGIVDCYLEVIDQFKPDIIHIFGTELAYGLIIEKLKVPVIVWIQGNLSVYEKKWFSGLSNYVILKHSSIKNIIYGYGTWHLFYLFKKRVKREKVMMRNCGYIIGRTDWDRRISLILSPNSKYFHCDDLLRSEFYSSKRWLNASHTRMILHSTLSALNYKGIETILETALLLKKDNLLNFEWHVAGLNGNEELVHIIQKFYGHKFTDFGVVFHGNLNPKTLIKMLLESDCYIHPSHIENSPNSVCEAMILGVPVIASYAGGTSNLIRNGIDGVLVQDGDPYSFAGAILEMYKDNDLKNKISYNAEAQAREKHNKVKVLQDLLKIYEAVLMDK
jgi:glycosyltransferase involved in cell wall biosynthesis